MNAMNPISGTDTALPFEEFAIDGCTADAGTLRLVLAAAHRILWETHRELPGGERHHELDEAAALVEVALKLAENLVQSVDDLPRPRHIRAALAQGGAV